MKEIVEEFKKFINRGNVVDLAVGVIVGGAFSKLVTGLVNYIIMPVVGLILGGVNFSGLSITFRNTRIMYGAFLQNVFDFFLISFCLFVVVKFMNKFNRKKEEKKVETPKKSDEVVLLEEIRDLLKKENKSK